MRAAVPFALVLCAGLVTGCGGEGSEGEGTTSGTPVGSWQVTAVLRGDALVSPLAATELTATFGADGKLNGSAGCNSYMGSYAFDGGTIEIAPPAATRKAFGEPEGVMEQEAAYLALLPEAVGFRVDGRALRLESADGAGLVVFTRKD